MFKFMHESIDYDEFGIGEITVWKKPTFLQSIRPLLSSISYTEGIKYIYTSRS
jgi:hypothetical protein